MAPGFWWNALKRAASRREIGEPVASPLFPVACVIGARGTPAMAGYSVAPAALPAHKSGFGNYPG